ncbi:MAG: transcription-repair coupling factor [Gammaproteobacteria bacterium]
MGAERQTSNAGLSPFLPSVPGPGERLRWSGLHGAARALALAQAMRGRNAPLVVITEDPLEAGHLCDELAFFRDGQHPFEVLAFPDWETLPYDRYSPYQDIVSERLATLSRLPTLGRAVLVAAVATCMHRLPPRQFIEANSLQLRSGETVPREPLCERLVRGGYRSVAQVVEHGDFALRGSLLDVFPMGSERPYRIDWLDDEIDAIRVFDPETQRSVGRVSEIRVLPARELSLSEAGIERFRGQWRARFEVSPQHATIYRDVSAGLAPGGIEYYLPLFFEASATLFDYCPADTLLVLGEGVEAAAQHFWQVVCGRYESGRHDLEHPLLAPGEMFIEPPWLLSEVKRYASIYTYGLKPGEGRGLHRYATRLPLQLPIDARAADPLAVLRQFLGGFEGRVLIAAESKGRRETLAELFRQRHLPIALYEGWASFLRDDAPLGLTVAPLEQGALIDNPRIALISESQLFGERARQERRRARQARDPEAVIRDLTELRIGAPVVHEQNGVGRYLGLFILEAGGTAGEYLGIEYADGDRLYVPVLCLHLVSRYAGVEGSRAPLHKLGSGQWQRARARAARRVHDTAAELLEVYARRAARKGHAFHVERDAYQGFVQGFPFEETPDQEAAIEAVLQDMQGQQPMDRLICGDVGFGKTEVAMRAAFVAAMDGKQVAVLVPTTLLAQQHFQNFKDRYADWPLRIEFLSRFQSKPEQSRILRGLQDGGVDLVVGTHKLLQAGIAFKRLGLLIIDEEHRFGVRHKEQLKALRADVDILTLTATPIPRTLNLALCGTRELSIIATPPARRLAIKTFVIEWERELLREAILREIGRGGQVYVLHNEVESIDQAAKDIAALVPAARVRVAHGQMRERDLEQVMLDFYHRRYNCLVCSTIIESGIDVPSANTIIIERADKLGLAQLYQLRGRVGRSHHRAYAYLVVPSRRSLKGEALKRLEAIESIEELGIGFTLATHDLEIRGAGEILGEEQSGHIQEIGFSLYMELLERAVRALKAGRQPDLDRPLAHGPEIDLHVPALIPADYLGDVHTRLILYKRIASAPSVEALGTLQEEMIDRFGNLPEAAANLFRLTRLKLRAEALRIHKIDLGVGGGRILFHPDAPIDPRALVSLIQNEPQRFRLDGGERLRIHADLPDVEARIGIVTTLLDRLARHQAA